jgi:hypothetical protein
MREHVRYGIDQIVERLAAFDNGDNWRTKIRKPQKKAIA